jgi:hypothetical protein
MTAEGAPVFQAQMPRVFLQGGSWFLIFIEGRLCCDYGIRNQVGNESLVAISWP